MSTRNRVLAVVAALCLWTTPAIAQQSVAVVSTVTTATTIADGSDSTLGAKADNKSTATDTTAVSLMSVMKEISAMEQANNVLLTTGTTANTLKRYISVGVTEDEFQVKATPGVLAGMSASNSHATTDAYVKCTNLTAANTTPGSSPIIYSMIVPHASGFVDRNIEDTFDTALTCYIVTGKTDADATEVGANDVMVNVSYR